MHKLKWDCQVIKNSFKREYKIECKAYFVAENFRKNTELRPFP